MVLAPIIERELRVALRKKRPERSRLKVAAVAVAVTCLLLLFPGTSRNAGLQLHHFFCVGCLYLILQTPRLTAGVLADERRQQTLGLLFLSGLGPVEIFASKFLSAAIVAMTDLLALAPMLALPFLLGGVSFPLFAATLGALPNLLLFALAISLLASSLARDDGTALILAALLALALAGVTVLIYAGQSHFSTRATTSTGWLLLSPAYGPYLLWTAFSTGPVRQFWLNWTITLAWSLICLGLAAWAVRSVWRERDEPVESASGRARWRNLVHGDHHWRARLSGRWLGANPFVWLAARDRQPSALAWMMVGGILSIWALCFAAWPARWPSVPNFFLTATLMNLAVRWVLQYTAARTLGESRRDGTYELLLTTPLGPSDIVWGQLEALRCQFLPVTRALVLLETVMMLAGLVIRPWTPGALFVYCLIWACLLGWAWSQSSNWRATLPVMWVALNCGRPAFAVWRASGLNNWAWLWMLFNGRFLFAKLPRFPTGNPGEVTIAVVMAVVIVLALVSRKGRRREDEQERRLMAEFREIAREPVPERDDKRFKHWNIQERFPWGWALAQQQLHERASRRAKGA